MALLFFSTFCEKMRKSLGLLGRTLWQVGRDDPRRAIHSVKMGLALTLVCFLILWEPLYKRIGKNAMWTILTVVVVQEFTAGATLCRGLNRGSGTVTGVLLAFLIDYIGGKMSIFRANLFFTEASIFFIGAATTYVRFIPHVKSNYDYGVVVFLVTFILIKVSSPHTNLRKMALERLYTIAIGCGICLLMTLFIFPIWSGEDLHRSTADKLEGLSKSIQACVREYFSNAENESSSDEDLIYSGYKEVLDSKSKDETLALHASWEPRHSRHRRYPCQQYVKVGAALRHFGYTVVALHGCLQTEIQTPKSCRAIFKDPCIRVAREVSNALMELANSVRHRHHCCPEILSDHLQKALQDLNAALQSQSRLFLRSKSCQARDMDLELSKIALTSLEFSEALPFAAFAYLLVESVARLDKVIEEVEELGRMACFKEYQSGIDEAVLNCETAENHFPSVGAVSLPIVTHHYQSFPFNV